MDCVYWSYPYWASTDTTTHTTSVQRIPNPLQPNATQRGGPNPALSGSGGLRGQQPPTPTFDASSLPASEAALRKRLSMDGANINGGGSGSGNNLMSPPAAKRPASSGSGNDAGGAPFMSPPAGGMPTPAARPAASGAGSGSGALPRATPSAVSPGSLQSPPPANESGMAPGQAYAQRANSGQRVVEMNPNLAPTRGATQPSKRFGGARCDIGVLSGPGQVDINLKDRYRYMYTTLEERARAQVRACMHACVQHTVLALLCLA